MFKKISHRVPMIEWKTSKWFKRWWQYMNKWFMKGDTSCLLNDASIVSLVNEAFVVSCNANALRLENTCGGSYFILYIKHVAPNYKLISSILVRAHPFHAIASKVGHTLFWCEIGCRGTREETVDYAFFLQWIKCSSQTITHWCDAFQLITFKFALHMNMVHSLHISHTNPMCTLDCDAY